MFQVRTLLAVAFLVLSFSVNSVNSVPIPKHDFTTNSEVIYEPALFKRMDPPNSKNIESITGAPGNQANLQEVKIDWDYLKSLVKEGQKEPLEELILAGAELNVRDGYGGTLLHYAAHYGRLDIMKILIVLGLDLHAKDIFGQTLLHYAANTSANNAEMIKFLFDSGAEVDARSIFGKTPLHTASTRARHNTANFVALLERGANPNLFDEHRNTPLHNVVVYNCNNEIFDALFEYGADLNVTNKLGKTPLALAKPHMLDYFNSKMAKKPKA